MSIVQFQTRAERLWAVWVEADRLAKQTLRFEDARAAGRAYRELMEEWLPPADLLRMCEERDRRRAAAR